MLNISNKYRTYILIFIVSVVVIGSSILFISLTAKNSEAKEAKEYPALNIGVAGVTYDNGFLAKNLVENKVFSRSENAPFEPDTWRTPGYPFFVAIFYYLFGSLYPVLIAHIFLVFLTSFFIFKIVDKLTNHKLALIASILYIILPGTLLAASALFNETLFVFISMSALYLFLFSEVKNMYLKWALTGLLLALTIYIRPASQYILLFFIPAYFIFYLKKEETTRQHIFATIFLIIVFFATLSPWYIRNKIKMDVWAFASTGPYVLFRQNATQFYAALNNIDIFQARRDMLEKAGIPEYPIPQDLKYSKAMQETAIEVITSHPFRYAIFHATSFIPFFTSSGINEYDRLINDLQPDFNPEPEPSLIQALHPFSLPVLITVIKNHGWTLVENFFWLIITVFAFLGMWFSKNKRLIRMFWAIIMYFALVTGPIAHARYRIPIEPLLLISAFSSVFFIWSNYREHFKNKLKILENKLFKR